MTTEEKDRLEAELKDLRDREQRQGRELARKDCVGARRNLAYRELEKVRRRLKAVWRKLKKNA